MKSLEFYQERAINSIKEGFSHKKKSDSFFDLLKELKKPSKYEKMTAALKLINELTPKFLSDELIKQINKKDRIIGELPFNPEKFEYGERVGQGGEHNVFLLESTKYNQPSFVVKINHSLSGNTDELADKAANFRKEYEEIMSLYSSIPGLVPEELTMVVANPKNNKPVVATVQRFFGTDIKDVLRDYNENELLELLNSDTQLRQNFQKFYEITEREYRRSGKAVDLLGNKNLSIIKDKEEHKLTILDPHNSVSSNDKDDRSERQSKRIHELKTIYETLDTPNQ